MSSQKMLQAGQEAPQEACMEVLLQTDGLSNATKVAKGLARADCRLVFGQRHDALPGIHQLEVG